MCGPSNVAIKQTLTGNTNRRSSGNLSGRGWRCFTRPGADIGRSQAGFAAGGIIKSKTISSVGFHPGSIGSIIDIVAHYVSDVVFKVGDFNDSRRDVLGRPGYVAIKQTLTGNTNRRSGGNLSGRSLGGSVGHDS